MCRRLIVLGLIVFAVQQVAAQLANPLVRKLDSLFHAQQPSGVYAISIISNGDEHANFFYNSKENSASPDEKTLFPLGSVSEVLLDLLLAYQVQSAVVTPNTFLEQLLPADTKVTYDVSGLITLFHLATHTSGLTSEPGTSYLRHLPSEAEQPAVFRELLLKKVKSFNTYNFSSYNTRLLAYLLSGGSPNVFENIKHHIVQSLAMSNTYAEVPAWYDNHIATKDKLPGDVSFYSTLRDLTLFLKSQLSPPKGKIGKAIALTQQTVWKDEDHELTLGWQKVKSGGEHLFLAKSQSCLLMFDKSRNKALVILAHNIDLVVEENLRELFLAGF